MASLLGPVLFLEFSPALLGAMWMIRWQLLASVAVALMVAGLFGTAGKG